MILIHTALLCEAQTFIEHFKLKKMDSKLYKNDKILIAISGIGEQHSIDTLEDIFSKYHISKAFNIGIAGTNNKSIEISQLFCTNHHLKDIRYLPLITTKKPQTTINSEQNNILYDMEGRYFENIVLKYLDKENIFIFKIVSDHLCSKILAKDYIKSLIKLNLKHIINYLTS